MDDANFMKSSLGVLTRRVSSVDERLSSLIEDMGKPPYAAPPTMERVSVVLRELEFELSSALHEAGLVQKRT